MKNWIVTYYNYSKLAGTWSLAQQFFAEAEHQDAVDFAAKREKDSRGRPVTLAKVFSYEEKPKSL
jgi:hypothetical protein